MDIYNLYQDERNKNNLTLKDHAKILWRRKKVFLFTFLLVFAGSGIMALVLSPVYQSSAKILVESQQIPEDLVRSTIPGFVDEHMQVTKQRVLTREKLMAIIKKYNLYSDKKESVTASELIENIRADINVSMIDVNPRRRNDTTTIAFIVSFQHKNPTIAQQVTNELVKLFLEENVNNRLARAAATTNFLDQEARKLRAEIEITEEQIAEYKHENKNNLPENLDLYLEIQERVQRELQDTAREINSLKEQKSYMEVQLSALKVETPNINSGENEDTPVSLLKKLQNEQLELSMQYHPSHPDLIILERKIADLRNRLDTDTLGKMLEDERSQIETMINNLTSKYTSNHPDIKVLKNRLETVNKRLVLHPLDFKQPEKLNILNPAILEVQLKLRSINSQMKSLILQENELKEKMNGLEQNILQTPLVERGIKVLMRDYENIKEKYQDIKAKQMEAQLSENLEAETKAERFSLLESPIHPEKPIKPNRKKILLLGILLAFGSSFGTVFLAERNDERVSNTKLVTTLLNQAPLVVIPYIINKEDQRKKMKKVFIYLAGIVLMCIAVLAAIHTYHEPLDILWDSIRNRVRFV